MLQVGSLLERNWNLAFGKTSEHEVLPTEAVRTRAHTEYPIAQTEGRFIALSNVLRRQPQPPPNFDTRAAHHGATAHTILCFPRDFLAP